jgi:hypothetical protein
MPVISVDTKSRELIGRFHQSGRRWSREPIKVFDHDFPSDARGVAIPYGIYDPLRNEGFVCVGTSRDTSAFAVDSLCTWWLQVGAERDCDADSLLILRESRYPTGKCRRFPSNAIRLDLIGTTRSTGQKCELILARALSL